MIIKQSFKNAIQYDAALWLITIHRRLPGRARITAGGSGGRKQAANGFYLMKPL